MGLDRYFLKSDAHRKLVELLFFGNSKYSAFELANLTHLPYATVHAELKKLKDCDAVHERTEGRSKYYQGALLPEMKHAFKALFGFKETSAPSEQVDESAVKAALQEAGGPVVAEQSATSHYLSLEETLVRAARLARKDASVARALPVVFSKHQHELDLDLLLLLARRFDAKQEAGFFLALTGELTNDLKLKRAASKFRDNRVHYPKDFFESQSTSLLQQQLADRNTPAVARKWKFRMNMSLESFRSTFERFSQPTALA